MHYNLLTWSHDSLVQNDPNVFSYYSFFIIYICMHMTNSLEVLYIIFKKKTTSVHFTTASHFGKILNLEWVQQTQYFFVWRLPRPLIQIKKMILKKMKAMNPWLRIFIQNSSVCNFFSLFSVWKWIKLLTQV